MMCTDYVETQRSTQAISIPGTAIWSITQLHVWEESPGGSIFAIVYSFVCCFRQNVHHQQLSPCSRPAPYLLHSAAKKREMDDNSKKLGQLFWKLNAGEVSAELLPQLLQLCAAIDAANWMVASGIQVSDHESKNHLDVVLSNHNTCMWIVAWFSATMSLAHVQTKWTVTRWLSFILATVMSIRSDSSSGRALASTLKPDLQHD